MSKSLTRRVCYRGGESPLERLHRSSQRYRTRETFYNEHYRDLCSRNDPTVCIPFQRPIESRCIHVHRRTKFVILSELIRLAAVTRLYTLDVQCDIDPCPWLKKNNDNVPALLQVEFHLAEASPLVLLIDMTDVPLHKRKKRRAIQLLCAKIFSSCNHIYTWRPLSDRLNGFSCCTLLDLCDLTVLNTYDVAQSFTEWYRMAFPRSRLSGETSYSLQTAIFLTFAEWLDTSMRYAPWSCGVDVDMLMDQTNLHRVEEQRELRRRMQDYALNNCFAISRLLMLLSSDASALENFSRSCRTIVHQKRQKRNKATTTSSSHRNESSNFYLRPTLETTV